MDLQRRFPLTFDFEAAMSNWQHRKPQRQAHLCGILTAAINGEPPPSPLSPSPAINDREWPQAVEKLLMLDSLLTDLARFRDGADDEEMAEIDRQWAQVDDRRQAIQRAATDRELIAYEHARKTGTKE